MDELARELGMSKKTLYRSFRSKDAMADALVSAKMAAVTSGIDTIMADPAAGFSTRARRVLDHVMTELSSVSPVFLRDLQRSMPHIYRRIENVRRNVVPELWGRLIREGQAEGLVRDDVDPAFAAELMLHAVQGVLHPETLQRLHLTPKQAFAKTTNLLLAGMLTAAGRRDHEKSVRSI
jgi:AcrR family transcriptional regulator